MSLKPYDELTGEQKTKVTKMYAVLSNLRDFVYDFDDKGDYHGREKKPVEKKAEPKKEQPKAEEKPKTTRRRRTTKK